MFIKENNVFTLEEAVKLADKWASALAPTLSPTLVQKKVRELFRLGH